MLWSARVCVMARRIQVVIDDDISGGNADETVTFGLDGVSYEIDLNERNAAKLRAALQPYLAAGRKVGATTKRTRTPKSTKAKAAPSRTAEIRAWAVANSVPVSARGRVGADVLARYEAAHA